MKRFNAAVRTAASPQRQISTLTALAGVVLLSFFFVPDALARTSVSTANVSDSFRRGFVVHWQSGSHDLPPQLETTVVFWYRFHLVKAGISALLLAVTVALGVALWRHFRQRPGGRSARRRHWLSCVMVGMLGLFALVALMANVQGATAPFASLLPMLTTGGADGELAATLTQVRHQANAQPSSGGSPVFAYMVREFAVYHAVLAAMSGVITCVLAGTSVMLWKRSRVSGGQLKRSSATGAAVSALLAAGALVIALSNAANAANSPQALAHFFAGSW
ncbi:tat (twin-arginine translocation) pathway signal sequence [Streptomyces sp. NPDC055952]|uniref:tat (twin-arginine translocation) pathway signal sequence n=1 Tax=Streptomyces sp. NPDC055952 TaxID=3345663 RepID=UPI0035D7D8E6